MIRVTLPWATFGLVIEDGVVTRAAPIAKYTIGWPASRAESYFLSRGAQVERL